MNKKGCLFVYGVNFLVLYAMYTYPTEYVYPLKQCAVNGQELLLFIHQTSNQETRLWSLNRETNQYEQLLSSQYNPVEVQLLPDNSGFSFLDNGLIKVKNFLKRSPKTIEIYEPIYNMGSIQWLDTSTCFFHAKQGNRYGIYQVDLDGQLNNIKKSVSCDYLYPQKVGTDLFFIRRDFEGNHGVEKMVYPSIKKTIRSLNEALDQEKETLESVGDKITRIQDFKKSTIINLFMLNEHEGLLVEHVPIINANAESISFRLYKLEFDAKSSWNKKELFLFSLPTSLFFDKATMLRDPMPALFPRITSDAIYFVSYNENIKSMSLYFYDVQSGSVEPCKDYSFFPVPKIYLLNGSRTNILMPIITQQGILSGYTWE